MTRGWIDSTRPFAPARAILLLAALLPALARGQVAHELQVELRPAEHRIEVVDTVTLPDAARSAEFVLHGSMHPVVVNEGAALRLVDHDTSSGGIPVKRYVVSLPPGTSRFTLRYGGEIHHPVERAGEEYGRGFGVSAGLVATQGVYLSRASHWYPVVPDALVTFDLRVTLPAGWRSMSQGRRTSREAGPSRSEESWREEAPQDEIFLVAGTFTEYRQPAGAAEAVVLLRQPEPELARKYLEATGLYLEMYRKLIGPYPYPKFALVENFWETGYGMPSFTLLGPTVIRLPFIVHSSYPHEILHNWWGNGVYVDYATGNWAEGLTSYLADHLIREQRGQGVAYRRATLQKYADYVRANEDFPLRAFRGRHSSVTEAVGYGKTMMVFHMLRRRLGDERFVAGLRRLYRSHRFRLATFDDVAAAFAAVAGEPLDPFFAQWVERPGAPSLRVRDAQAGRDGEAWVLTATLEQVQAGEPYDLRVPVAVHVAGETRADQREIVLDGRRKRFELRLSGRPLRLDVDPEFDVFRRLDWAETPPAVSQALGAEQALFVLPAAAPERVRRGYQRLAESWGGGRADGPEVRRDVDLVALPHDRAVWLFGWENRFRASVESALAEYDFTVGDDVVRLVGTPLTRADHAVVAVGRHPSRPAHALVWVALANVDAMAGLARKLPHYGKYSFLGFRGDEPTNVAKGQWPVLASPLSVSLGPERVGPARLARRQALVEPPAVFSAERMARDVRVLADPSLGGRGLGTPGLDRAAEHIAERFRALGLVPAGDAPDSYFQTWRADVGKPLGAVTLKNVVAVVPGTRPEWAAESVVVGAHYDHLGRGWPDVHRGDEGEVHPGADDNASGVAVMLELARVMRERSPPRRSVVFAAFSGEEAGKLGAKHYVRHAERYPAREIIGMINLDTVGRLGERELLVLGASSAREWVHIFRGAGFVTGVPVKTVESELDSSDHTIFIAAGVPAVQLFSGPHPDYHRPSDTSDKIDPAGMAKVAMVLDEAVSYLAARGEPLDPGVGRAKRTAGPTGEGSGRRASLGTVPDFGYAGEGVRLSSVIEASPAHRAGLRGGDVIIGVGDRGIGDLRAYADALRALSPQDQITIHFLRDGAARSVTARVVAR